MSYPGNASLSSAVKDRVVSTFQQTLALYHQRRTDEVAAGCTLILQMDPMFDPARKLMEKVRNPSLPIDVDMLLPQSGGASMQQAREAMAGRDFERVLQLTSAILSEDLLNDDARVLADEAREKLEAGPFVTQFTARCDQSLAAGNIAAAKMDLEKARALDPAHPEVLRIARSLASRDAAPASAAPPPSFVIDAPTASQTGRSAAQATDFGFAFEEEKAEDVSFANFSFDTPSTPAAAPADSSFGGFSFDSPSPPAADPYAPPDEFDFATASVATNSDDQSKIRQFLNDGDRALAGGDYQQAIDLWSRIFLIDVTNDEASDRIENAKAKRREIDQQIEPLLASGIAAFERGNTAQAHKDLNEVLGVDPQNATAQGYLDRLGETVVEGGATARSNPYLAPSVLDDDKLEMGFFDDDLPSGIEAPLVPPSPGTSSPSPSPKNTGKVSKPKIAAPPRKLPIATIAAVLGAIVLLGGGWFAWQRFQSKPAVETGAGQAVIARATTLAGIGKYDQAIALLQDIKPDDPQHDQALVMIADLRKKKSSAAQMIDGIPADQFFQQRVDAATAAFETHDYAVAKTAFDQAMRVKPLSPELKAQYDAAAQQVAKLDSARALFSERKFADAIANLQPLLEQDPENLAIQKLLSDAHFNSAATALQDERTAEGIRELDEVLKANPADDIARRTRELALRYDGQPKDLLYKIYVKYLPLRQAT
ncbi:MAG: tetratricopeptide repeat protein [Acidobacteriota bacterium]|nr:tetratricopeptide repeat protein [Acidobacteriota bacterium]